MDSYINKNISTKSEIPKNEVIESDEYDWIGYMNRYEDLRNAFGYNIDLYINHYNTYGKNEKRILKKLNSEKTSMLIVDNTKPIITSKSNNSEPNINIQIRKKQNYKRKISRWSYLSN